MSESHSRGRRRPPIWLWVVAGVLLVGVAAVAALLMSNRGGGPVPEAEVVTLPPPTPTVDAISREAGTALFDALPSTVLAFALSATSDAPALVQAGALEAYTMQYTDGSQQVTVVVGQWPTDAEAEAAYQAAADAAAAVAAAPPVSESPSADESVDPEDTTSPTPVEPVEEGGVEAGGTEVGRYTLALRADGTATMVWRNGTVMLQADGPAGAVRDLYTGYAL